MQIETFKHEQICATTFPLIDVLICNGEVNFSIFLFSLSWGYIVVLLDCLWTVVSWMLASWPSHVLRVRIDVSCFVCPNSLYLMHCEIILFVCGFWPCLLDCIHICLLLLVCSFIFVNPWLMLCTFTASFLLSVLQCPWCDHFMTHLNDFQFSA